MGAPVAIRKAVLADGVRILSCLSAAFEAYAGRYTRQAFEDTVLSPETIVARLMNLCVLVAVDEGGEVVGTLGYSIESSGEGHLRGMAVRPAWQGRGVAQRLLNAAEEALYRSGCRRVSLDTTAPLVQAVRFYEKNGFRASGRISDFFGMPLTEYEKPLDHRA